MKFINSFYFYRFSGFKKTTTFFKFLVILILVIFSVPIFAQVQNYDEAKRGSIYFTTGYNIQFFNQSTIHVVQDALKNDYKLMNAPATDMGGATTSFSPLKLSYRFGYFFNYNQDQGIEISYDPFKYFIQNNSNILVQGTKDGIKVNNQLSFSKQNKSYYYLYNGLGNIQFSYIGRFGLYRKVSYNFAIDLIGKAGIGISMPNVENSLDSQKNIKGVQLGGVNFGIETGARWISHRHFCVDVLYKYGMAMLGNLQVYQGTASQTLTSGALVLDVGIFLPTKKGNPLFEKGWAHRKKIIHTRQMYLIDSQY